MATLSRPVSAPPSFHSPPASSDLAPLRVRAISHQTHGLDGLAALGSTSASAASLHAGLSGHGIDSVVLTTCNRFELYWRSRSPQDDILATSLLAAVLRATDGTMSAQPSYLTGNAAAHYLFRVCAGLESVVLGEAEILGQARAALEACPCAGSFLTGVFRGAIRAGRAARAETAIGEGAMSVASTAIRWLSQQMQLGGSRVLIIGAGDTARKSARHLRAIGAGTLVVANRTRSRAEVLAASVDGRVTDWDALPHEIGRADAIISAVHATGWVITLDQLRCRVPATTSRLFLIDLSMPPSIEPGHAVNAVRVDLSAIEQLANQNRKQREAEAPQVEAVIARELAWLQRWATREAVRPVRSAHFKATRAGL